MIVEEIFEFGKIRETDPEVKLFIDEMFEEGIMESVGESYYLAENRIASSIQKYIRQYGGSSKPEIMAFVDKSNPNHHAILAAGDGMFYRFDLVNDKVVGEERYRNFKELMDERELLMSESFRPVDHRTFLKKNWKKILMWLVGGSVVAFVGIPLLVAAIVTTVAPAAAFVGKLLLGTGTFVAVGWLSNKILGQAAGTSAGDWG